MATITEFEFIDHGIDGSQYFQGCGTTFTRFNHVATGCGSDPSEAVDDCLEQMAQCEETDGVDFKAFEQELLKAEGRKKWPTRPTARGEDMYYYVSIRYNVG